MRQVYLTIGGTWGQLLVGRELGLFSRQNILTDQTLFGVGTTGNGVPGDGAGTTNDDARTSYGFIGQATVTPAHSKLTLAASYGSSYLKASQAEKDLAADFRTENTLISGGLYYQATKSLKLVGEFDYWWTKGKLNRSTPPGVVKNSQWAPVVGAMLFF